MVNQGYIDPFVGNQLREKREAQNLSVEFVATQLRLSKEYIQDIESSNFTKLPHTYLKGYVRAYAKLLAVPESEINIYLMSANKKSSLKGWQVFSSQKQISFSNRYFQWLTFAIFSTLIVLAALWWKSDSQQANSLEENDSTVNCLK
jgi:cytoskeleton protein RodZ